MTWEKPSSPSGSLFTRFAGNGPCRSIRGNLDALFADKKPNLPAEAKTVRISRSTVGRMLKKERPWNKIRRTRATKRGTTLKQQIQVRTFRHWVDKQAGFTGVDTVSPDGGFA
jgi:hypothetical protein